MNDSGNGKFLSDFIDLGNKEGYYSLKAFLFRLKHWRNEELQRLMKNAMIVNDLISELSS